MIEPSELHRYFKVRHIASDREVWVLGDDARYERVGDGMPYGYRLSRDGEYFLACASLDYGFGWPLRLDEVEPLTAGQGVYAVPDELGLTLSYEGSWRQYANTRKEQAA